jgi:hypothetical protein
MSDMIRAAQLVAVEARAQLSRIEGRTAQTRYALVRAAVELLIAANSDLYPDYINSKIGVALEQASVACSLLQVTFPLWITVDEGHVTQVYTRGGSLNAPWRLSATIINLDDDETEEKEAEDES